MVSEPVSAVACAGGSKRTVRWRRRDLEQLIGVRLRHIDVGRLLEALFLAVERVEFVDRLLEIRRVRATADDSPMDVV